MPQIPIRTMLQLASPQRDRLPSSPRFVSARSQLYSQRLSECSSQSCSLARCNLVAEGCGDFRPSRADPDIRVRWPALRGTDFLRHPVWSEVQSVRHSGDCLVAEGGKDFRLSRAAPDVRLAAVLHSVPHLVLFQSVIQSTLQSVLQSAAVIL